MIFTVYSGPLQFNDFQENKEIKIQIHPVENEVSSFWKQAKDEMKELLLSPHFQHLFPRFSIFEASGKKSILNLLRLHK